MTAKDFVKTAARKTWEYIKIARLELLILVGFLTLDLVSKAIVDAVMIENGPTTVVIPGLLNFCYTINPAAAMGFDFGLGKAARPIFLILTVPAVCAFSYAMYRFRGRHVLSRITFAMIVAGTLGNFYDRLFVTDYAGQHGVRDFIQFDFNFFPFIFNVADIVLVVGVGLFALYFIFLYKEPRDICGPVFQPDYIGVENGIEATNGAETVNRVGAARTADDGEQTSG